MQIGSRIRAAHAALASLTAAEAPDSPSALVAFQKWVTSQPAAISKTAAAAFGPSKLGRWFLEADVTKLPVTREALGELSSFIGSPPGTTDPVDYVYSVLHLCRRLTLFRDGMRGCPHCQGELELWCRDEELFEICALSGHWVRAEDELEPVLEPEGLRPASREAVLKRFPDARLVFARS